MWQLCKEMGERSLIIIDVVLIGPYEVIRFERRRGVLLFCEGGEIW